ncbi:hypothetical protein BC834DRAFT_912706 [Gloeopeniophorella convolvens]|nr:hypothetical protein BC834DRAFT_912706 [Gloeopeniophorella convolvens]
MQRRVVSPSLLVFGRRLNSPTMPSNSPTYTLYDIPGNAVKHLSWSPNVWKIRIVLNYKAIPHKTEWVEFHDIAALAQRLGAPPTAHRRDGTPFYTVPILVDPRTDKAPLSDSLQIALALERAHPDTPTLFPPGSEDAIAALDAAFTRKVGGALAPLLIARVHAQLVTPEARAYFRTSRERMFRGRLEELPTPARWAALRDALAAFAREADARGASDTFLLGERETYADVIAYGWLGWARRLWGAEAPEWREVGQWDGGRWGRLVDAFKQWEYVDVPSALDLPGRAQPAKL